MQLKKSLLRLQPLLMVALSPRDSPAWPRVRVGLQLSPHKAKNPKTRPWWSSGVFNSPPCTYFHRPFCLSGSFPFFPPLLQQTHLRILLDLGFISWTSLSSPSQASIPDHQAALSAPLPPSPPWISSILTLLAQKCQQGFVAWADVSTQSRGGAQSAPVSAGEMLRWAIAALGARGCVWRAELGRGFVVETIPRVTLQLCPWQIPSHQ